MHAYVKQKLLKQPPRHWYILFLKFKWATIVEVCFKGLSHRFVISDYPNSRSRLQEANQECTEMKKKLQECMAQRGDLAAQNTKKDKLIKESDENARKQVDQVSINTESTYLLRVYHNLSFS